MPIHCPIATQRITQDEFKQIAGEVMQPVFTIQKRLIGHTTFKTVHWANITQASVTFTTLTG